MSDDVAHLLASRLADRADTEAERVLGELLEQLREPGEWPPPAQPARPAFPAELPPVATNLIKAAVEPWRTRAYLAPSGSVPYTFERKRAGWLATPIAYVRLAHPDGRRAVAVWTRDQLAQRGKTGAKEWTLTWAPSEVWRWRGGPDGTSPQRTALTTLKAAVADATWRTSPYVIEEAA